MIICTFPLCTITIGVSAPEASAVMTMQDNPSHTAVEGRVVLEPNPCYSNIQANSGYEPISGKGKVHRLICTCVLHTVA